MASSSWMTQNRVPKGSPEAGEWSEGRKGEAEGVSLGAGSDGQGPHPREWGVMNRYAKNVGMDALDKSRISGEISAFIYGGGQFRASTERALDTANSDPDTAYRLMMRDVHYEGKEDDLRDTLSTYPMRPSAPYSIEPHDYAEVYAEPSPELVENLYYAAPDGSDDDLVVRRAHNDLMWKAGRRAMGEPDTSAIPEMYRHGMQEVAPGAVAFKDGSGPMSYALTARRNETIPAQHRSPSGLYSGTRARMVEQYLSSEVADLEPRTILES